MQTFFYQPETTAKVAAIAMGHWFTALSDIPEAAIEQAIRARMLKSDKSKPKPGEIREDALGHIYQPPKALKLAPPPVVFTNEELVERREMSLRLHKAFPKLWRMPMEGEEC